MVLHQPRPIRSGAGVSQSPARTEFPPDLPAETWDVSLYHMGRQQVAGIPLLRWTYHPGVWGDAPLGGVSAPGFLACRDAMCGAVGGAGRTQLRRSPARLCTLSRRSRSAHRARKTASVRQNPGLCHRCAERREQTALFCRVARLLPHLPQPGTRVCSVRRAPDGSGASRPGLPKRKVSGMPS